MSKRYALFFMITIMLASWIITSKHVMGIDGSNSISTGSWYVSTLGNDSNDCSSPATPCLSIRAVLNKPEFIAGNTIYVSAGVYTSATSPEVILLNKNVILSGGWDNSFSSQSGATTIDGGNARRCVLINSGIDVTIDRFIIQKGFTFEDFGSGIKNLGNLHIKNASIQNNQAGMVNEPGDAAGIYNSGNLTIEKSSIRENIIYNQYHTNGGGLYNDGGNVIINQSSITKNFASQYGGGIYNSKGGTITILNSTISHNQAVSEYGGSGIHNGIPVTGFIHLFNSTVSDNIGIGIVTIYPDTVTLQNTILANNLTYDKSSAQDCQGPLKSLGYNLVESTASCDFSSNTGDIHGLDPELFMLYGEPAYKALFHNSPAINAGNPEGCKNHLGELILSDQRGVSRSGRCDIGAYEYDASNDPAHRILMPIIRKSCLPIFLDDFQVVSNWPVLDTGDTVFEYSGGEYRMLLRNPYWYAAAHPGINYRWFDAGVYLRNPNNVMGSYGIIFEIKNDYSEFLSFEIYPDGWFGIYHYYSDYYMILYEDFSPAVRQGTEPNLINIVVTDPTHFKAYANGQLLQEFDYNGFIQGGYIGLIAWSYDQPNLDIRFDNFSIFSPSCTRYETPMMSKNDWMTEANPFFSDKADNPVKHRP